MAPRSVSRLQTPVSGVPGPVRLEPETGTQGRVSSGGEGVGPRQGPKRVNPAGHFTMRGLGEDSSRDLGTGLPTLALRFLTSLHGERERGLWSGSWSGNEKN